MAVQPLRLKRKKFLCLISLAAKSTNRKLFMHVSCKDFSRGRGGGRKFVYKPAFEPLVSNAFEFRAKQQHFQNNFIFCMFPSSLSCFNFECFPKIRKGQIPSLAPPGAALMFIC
jgi:hypothetical protein